ADGPRRSTQRAAARALAVAVRAACPGQFGAGRLCAGGLCAGRGCGGRRMSGRGGPGAVSVDAHGLRVAILATRWHEQVTEALVAGAHRALAAARVEDLAMLRVPGA